jgi:hypothetical protein
MVLYCCLSNSRVLIHFVLLSCGISLIVLWVRMSDYISLVIYAFQVYLRSYDVTQRECLLPCVGFQICCCPFSTFASSITLVSGLHDNIPLLADLILHTRPLSGLLTIFPFARHRLAGKLLPLFLVGFISSLPQLAWDKRLSCCWLKFHYVDNFTFTRCN